MQTLRQHLAYTLRDKMRVTLSLNTQTKVSQKSGLAQSTVQRILKCEQAATVDVIADLATAFNVRPAQYFLLDKDEADLLAGFAKLEPADKHKLLTFIDIAGQAKFVQDARSQLNFMQERPVPVEDVAATKRASSRVLGGSTQAETNVTQNSNIKEKRRSA